MDGSFRSSPQSAISFPDCKHRKLFHTMVSGSNSMLLIRSIRSFKVIYFFAILNIIKYYKIIVNQIYDY